MNKDTWRFRCLLVLAASAAVAGLSGRACAQATGGAVRIGLEGEAVRYEKTTISLNGNDADSSETDLGLVGNGAGINLGYGLGDFVVGGRLLIASSKVSTEPSVETTTTTVRLLPTLEYLFEVDGPVKPFVAGTIGYEVTEGSITNGYDITQRAFVLGPSVGMHAFALPGLSVDSSLGAAWKSGSLESSGVTFDRSGFAISLNVGISAWFGADAAAPKPSEAATPTATPAPAATPAPSSSSPSFDRGVITASFVIDDPAHGPLHVVLRGEPRKEGNSAEIMMSWSSGVKPAEPCPAAALVADGTRLGLADVQSKSDVGSVSTITFQRGRASLDALETLGAAHAEAAIDPCGIRWSLSTPQRRIVYNFVERFRERAEQGGKRAAR